MTWTLRGYSILCTQIHVTEDKIPAALQCSMLNAACNVLEDSRRNETCNLWLTRVSDLMNSHSTDNVKRTVKKQVLLFAKFYDGGHSQGGHISSSQLLSCFDLTLKWRL